MTEPTVTDPDSKPEVGPLLSIRGLGVRLRDRRGELREVLRGIDIELCDGESLAVIGESGCGKTVLVEVLTGLVEGAICDGVVHFRGHSGNLLKAGGREIRKIRGGQISYLFGGVRDSLHAHVSIREQMVEIFRYHRPEVQDFDEEIIYWMSKVGIADPEGAMRSFAWRLNLMTRMRIGVAMAMGTLPRLLIADEPTAGLDQTNREHILDLIEELTSSAGTTVLLVTRDLRIACKMAKKIAVMEDGRIVESGDTAVVVKVPQHRLTRELLEVTPGMTS